MRFLWTALFSALGLGLAQSQTILDTPEKAMTCQATSSAATPITQPVSIPCDCGPGMLPPDPITGECVEEPPPPPPPPPPVGDPYHLVRAAKPPPGEWGYVAGSAMPDSVSVNTVAEFSDCLATNCFNSPFLYWSSAALDKVNGTLYAPAAGGHTDSGANQVYKYDFASNVWNVESPAYSLTVPHPVKPQCLMPGTGAPAVHHYDGIEYVPTLGIVTVTGQTPFCIQAVIWGGMPATWSPGSGWGVAPTSWGAGSRFVYDSDTQILFDISDVHFREYDATDPALPEVGTPYIFGSWSQYWGDAEIDRQSRYIYWGVEGFGVRRRLVSLDGTRGPIETVPGNASIDAAIPGMISFEVHSPTGDLYFMRHDSVYRWQDDGTFDALPVLGTPPPVDRKSERAFDKWIYIESEDVFVFVTDDGVWTFSPVAP